MISPWPRIDTWLAAHAPAVLAALRPSAPSGAIARLAAAAGRALPPGVISMYSAHDGAAERSSTVLAAVRAPSAAQWARYMWWLPVEGAVERLTFLRGLGSWPDELLPFALDAGGNLLVVDLASGRVSAWDHETAETTPLAEDLDAWFAALADDMDSELVAAPNQDPDQDLDDGRLLLLAEPPLPSAPPPVLAEDRSARVFLEVLQERNLLELAARADVEPLVRALQLALAIEDARAREACVIAILSDDAAIDELFASDAQIVALIEEIA